MALSDYFTGLTLADAQATIAQFAGLGNLILSSWYSGSAPEQLYQAFSQALVYFGAGNAKIVRGFVLDYATDPGDDDPYDASNALLEPAPGLLSALGQNVFFTTRPGATFASTTILMSNSSGTPYTFAPGQLTIAKSGASAITYRNAPDPARYTGAAGTYTLAAGASAVPVTFAAESPGTAYGAPAATLTVFVNAFPGVTVTNPGAAVGSDRMAASDYRALCREQAGATSPNGASDAYRYCATTNLDGSPLLQSLTATPPGDGVTAVAIARVYVSKDSSTGIVAAFYATSTGAATAVDTATANENILTKAVPDAVTFSGFAAVETPITVTWQVKYLARYQGRAVLASDIVTAISAALTAREAIYPIGGFDQVLGAGTIYASDLRGVVERAHGAIYSATVSAPAADVAIALGHVATLTADTAGSTQVAG